MPGLIVSYSLLLLACCIAVALCIFGATRSFLTQVLVIRRSWAGPEYRVYGYRNSTILLLLLIAAPAFHLVMAQCIETILGAIGIDSQVSFQLALFPNVISLFFGWSLGIGMNGFRHIKALEFAEKIYNQGYGDIKEEYEVGYKGKTATRIVRIAVDELIIVVDDDSEVLSCFLASSPKERIKKYPILQNRRSARPP